MILIDCKLCGQKHKAGEDCPVPVAERPAVKAINRIPPFKAVDKIDVVVVSEAIKPDLKAGYNAYMREYMRKKRAKDKAK